MKEPEQHTIVVAIVTNDQNQILLAKRHEPESKHSHNKWEFIGGGIEFGETPEQAVIREAKEEAGIDLKVIRLIPSVTSHIWKFDDGSQQQILILSYLGCVENGIPTPNLAHNTGEIKFFSLEEIEKLETLPQVYEMAKIALIK